MQCTATAKSTGERCRRRAVTGYTVCQVHGAGSPKQGRPGGRPIVHGRYSKHLPARLAERYGEALSDPELLALREEVALTDARIADLLKRVDTGESGRLWRGLGAAWKDFTKARHGKDTDGMAAALDKVGGLIGRGQADYATWGEIGGLLDQRRRLVESERKRLVEMQQVITAEKAMILLAAVVDVIRKNIDDRDVIAAISADIRRIVAADPGR
jgi:hypothetical protein